MSNRYLLLLVGLVLAVSSAAAFTTINPTTTTAFGGILSANIVGDGTLQAPLYTVDQVTGATDGHIFVKGINALGGTALTATTQAQTSGVAPYDIACSVLKAGKDAGVVGDKILQIQNLNTYAYVTRNLAWTGIYADKIEASAISTVGSYAQTRTAGGSQATTGVQKTDLNWLGANPTVVTGTSDFTATQIWYTNEAGGSYDTTQFPVGSHTTWGGKGSYAMSNMNFGTFKSAGPNVATDKWDTVQSAVATDKFAATNTLQAGSSTALLSPLPAYTNEFTAGGLTFKVNTPGVNYADSDLVYSNTDLGIVAGVGSGPTMQAVGTGYWNNYYPKSAFTNTQQVNSGGAKSLLSFNNVFTYGYENSFTDAQQANVIFY